MDIVNLEAVNTSSLNGHLLSGLLIPDYNNMQISQISNIASENEEAVTTLETSELDVTTGGPTFTTENSSAIST